jgi:hypothetical protein
VRLVDVVIFSTGMAAINITGLASLTALGVRSNRLLKTLTVSTLPRLASLDMLGNTALEYCSVTSVHVAELALSALYNLKYLVVRGNSVLTRLSLEQLLTIEIVDVRGNDALATVLLDNVGVTEFDLAGNLAIFELVRNVFDAHRS